MFKDKDEELKRLEAALLQEEEAEAPEEEFPQDFSDALEAPAGHCTGKVYNADRVDLDPEELSRELLQPKKRTDILILSAIAMALVAGIFAVLIWWAVRFL